MTSGLKLSTAAIALLAVAGIGAAPASAADLGGNCCADLEERIAELEATTARKGNRKVSLEIYGQVNEAIGFWDDGLEENTYIFTNDTSRTRFGFKGKAKITGDWYAAYRLEIGVRSAGQQGMSADNITGNSGFDLRHSSWTLGSKTYGDVTVGQTSFATDGIVQIQTANIGHFSNNDIFDFPSSFVVRGTAGNRTWINLIQNREPGEGSRGQLIRYDSPAFGGFTGSAHWGEDDIWGLALRYKGEIGDFKLAAGIGYGEMSLADEECTATGTASPRSDLADCREYGGSASVMHGPTGLFVTGAYGVREDELRAAEGGSEDNTHWLVQAGIEQKWFALGKTTVFGGYQHRDAGRSVSPADTLPLSVRADTEVEMFEVGLNQQVSAAAMDFYLHYKHYQPEVAGSPGAEDFQTLIGGAMIKF